MVHSSILQAGFLGNDTVVAMTGSREMQICLRHQSIRFGIKQRNGTAGSQGQTHIVHSV